MEKYLLKIELYFELKGSPESSRESYLRRINAFILFVENQHKTLENIDKEDIQQYILYLKNQKKLAAGTINNYISAIKFFYTHVLGKEWDAKKIPRMKRITSFPVIPPKEDILAMIEKTSNLKHKSFFVLLYGSGLRVSEVAKLKIGDICSRSMRIRVDNAKHGTNRYTILSHTALSILKQYFKTYFTPGNYTLDDWLFPGQKASEHVSIKTIKNTLIKVRNRLDLNSNISAHTLRHAFATHSLESGINPIFIQQMLGHKDLRTTTKYLFMTSKSLMGIESPLDGKQK